MTHQAAFAEELTVQAMRQGPGFVARAVRGDDEVMDPFLMIDQFWMSEPTFGPHPHAGFSAITYLFDDSESALRNRDSRGDESLIKPGDLHWTNAGSGILHDEIPDRHGHSAHGLQIFVNLPAARKHNAPSVMRLAREKMPIVEQPGGALIKLVFGPYEDTTRRIEPLLALPTDASLFDIQLAAGTEMRYPLESTSTIILLVIGGTATIGSTLLDAGKAVAFDRAGGELNIRAEQTTQIVLFLGEPLREPVVRHGPFVMNSQTDIDQAIADYQAGKMGHL